MGVKKWLEEIGLAQYAEAFAENGVNLDLLPDLTNEDLKDLGVSRLADRKAILKGIDALGKEASALGNHEEIGIRGVDSGPYEPDGNAQRRQLTVLFADMVGSTELSNRLDPEQLRDVILDYQNALTAAVERYDGHVAKFMGDGVLAYFGWPEAHEDDAERAIRAGLTILSATSAKTTPGGDPIETRIGVATGLVVVGDLIGEGGAQEETVVGETPNLAARLQGCAAPNQIVIAETTHKLLGKRFAFVDLGEKPLKGFSGPVRAWAVMGELFVEGRFAAQATTESAIIVGREQEIALLLDRWGQAIEGEGQIVVLSGEAGIGKSHIVQSFSNQLLDADHNRLHFQCSPHHINSALHPIIEQLMREAGFTFDDPQDVRLSKLERLLEGTSTALTNDVRLFAALLSIPSADDAAALSLSPEQQKARTLDALIERLAALSEQKPLLLVFEDTQWIDPTSAELLDQIMARSRSGKVMVLITCRPEATYATGAHAHATTLTLNRLGDRVSRQLIDELADHKPLPEEVLKQILAKTDGVPLFVEELTKEILESGLLSEETDRFELAGPLPTMAIPASLSDSLLARLDRLGPAKKIAQLAACIGREFGQRLLVVVSGLPETQVKELLQRLVNAELIYQTGLPSDASFTFKHGLVQEAARESLLKSKRREHHQAIAGALLEHFPELVTAQPEQAAYHFQEASMFAEAADHWLRAGRQAAGRSAITESVGHLRSGLGAVSRLPASTDRDRHELSLQLALCSPLMSELGWGSDETKATYARARELCLLLDETVLLLPVLFGQWIDHCLLGRLREGSEVAEDFLDLSERQDDRVGIMQGHRMLGFTKLFQGEYGSIAPHVDQSIKLYKHDTDQDLALDWVYDPFAGGLIAKSYSQFAAGLLEQANLTADRAIAHARDLNHVSTLVYTLINASCPAVLAGDAGRALTLSGEALSLAEEHEYPYDIAWARMLKGWSIGKIDDPEKGLPVFQQGFQSKAYDGLSLYRPMFLGLLAELLLANGEVRAAQESLHKAIQLVEQTNERLFEAETLRLSGDAILAKGTSGVDRAKACFEKAMEVAGSQGVKPFELRAALALCEHLTEHGDPTGAYDLLAPLYSSFAEDPSFPDLVTARRLLDTLR